MKRRVLPPESALVASTKQPRFVAGLFRYGMLVLVCAYLAPAFAWSCDAQVERVHDADTLTLRCPDRRFKLRLQGIDAPELGQPYGEQARLALQQRIGKRVLRVESRATDVYQRVIGRAQLDGVSLEDWLVTTGWAWCAPRSATQCRHRQDRAKKARRGLWADAETPIAPWIWRAEQARSRP